MVLTCSVNQHWSPVYIIIIIVIIVVVVVVVLIIIVVVVVIIIIVTFEFISRAQYYRRTRTSA